MQNINFSSRDSIENTLWEVGLNIHNLTHHERLLVLENVLSNHIKFTDGDILNFAGYVLHSYMMQMDDAEKRILIDIVVDRFVRKSGSLGEGLELIALLVKGCPVDCRTKLVGLIVKQNFNENSDPSRIISYANAIRYIFDEIDVEDQLALYESLRSLLCNTRYDYLRPTILYTVSNIKALLK